MIYVICLKQNKKRNDNCVFGKKSDLSELTIIFNNKRNYEKKEKQIFRKWKIRIKKEEKKIFFIYIIIICLIIIWEMHENFQYATNKFYSYDQNKRKR